MKWRRTSQRMRGRWYGHRVGFMAGIVFAAMCAAPAPATAATWWWNTLTTGLWTNGANWSNAASGGSTGTAPTNDTTTDVVVFNTTGTNGAIVSQLSQDQSIGGITVNNTGATTLQSDSATTRQLFLGVGGIAVNSGAGAFTIGTTGSLVNIAMAGSQTWTNNSSSLLAMSSGTLSSSVAGTQTLTIAGSGSTMLGSVLANGSGTLALAKSGAGTLTLSGLSTFTGGLTVTGGTLALQALSGSTASIQANQNFSITNATLTTAGSFYNALGRQPGGWTSGTATINAGGLLFAGNTSLNSHNLFDVVLSGGTMGAGAGTLDGALANFYIAGGITATGSTASTISASLGRQSGTIPNTTLPIAVDAGSTLTVSGPIVNIVGANGLSKTGAGLLTLSGSNSYSGGTTISGGLLRLGNARGLGATTGALTVSGGGLDLNGNSITTGAVSITAAASSGDTIQSGTLSGSSYTVSNTSGNAVISAVLAGSGALSKSGAGTLTLSAANSYSGVTTFTSGTVNVSSLSNYGANGSLGNRASGSDTAGEVALLFRGGVLQYTGSTAQSTNRGIRVGTEGATLDASGSSPEATMSFTAASSAGFLFNPGARTITFTGSNTGNNTFAMTIADAGGTRVVKSGQGTWVLSGSSTYNAGTTISDGLLRIGNARALGVTTGALTVSGGRLDLDGNSITTGAVSITAAATTGDTIQSGTLSGSSYTVSNPSGNAVISAVLAGSGGVDKLGAGNLTLSAANTYSGITTLWSGTVNVASLSNYGANGSLGNRAVGGDGVDSVGLLFRGGVLQYTGSTAQTTNRAIRVSYEGATLDASGSSPEATMSFTATSSPNFIFFDGSVRTIRFTGSNTGNNTFAMAISETGGATSVSKSGPGAWVLSGSSSYSGITTFAGGTLNVSSLSNYGVNGSLGNRAVGSDVGSSIGLLFKGGVLQYTGSTAQSTNRAIRVGLEGATFDASGSSPEATMSFTATSSPNLWENIGARTITFTGSNTGNNTFAMTLSDAGAMSVVKSGQGKWVLSGSSSYTGGTQINGGTLSLGHASALGNSGTISFGGGVLQFSSSNTTDYSNRFSTAANQAYAIDTNGQTVSFAAGLTSSGGSLTKMGTGLLVLSASSSYNGGTSITAGTLRAANVRAFGSGTLTLASGATLDINNLAVANTITSNGGTILNAASFTGTTALSSGTTALQSIGGTVDIDASAVADLSGTINAVVTVKAGGRGRASGQIQKNVTVSGGGQFDILNDATIDEAASFSFANNGQIYIDRTNNLTLSKVISGTGGLRKSGNSRVTLTGANTFTGATQIDAGTLVVNGALAGDVTVALGATLGGSGVLGDMLSGAGTISVGNSPGIGTAASVEPFAGTDWVFEITGTAPTWNAGASASVNDVLRLTDVTPFASSLAPGNVVDVLFNLTSGGPVGQGDYLGGFFIDNESFNLAAALAGGTFRYWVAGEYGTVEQRQSFNVGAGGSAVAYSLLAAYDSSLSANFTVTQRTVNFGSGDVTGSVTQFVIVPEPTTLVIAAIGIAMAGWLGRKRRRITDILPK